MNEHRHFLLIIKIHINYAILCHAMLLSIRYIRRMVISQGLKGMYILLHSI